MKTFFNLLAVIILLSSCNTMKQNDKNDKFFLDDSHLEDKNILNEKKQVIEFIKTFDKWYKNAGSQIVLAPIGWYMVGYDNVMTDEFRIHYIKTTVLKEVEKTDILTNRLREKVIHDIMNQKDPQNLGTLLLADKEYMGRYINQFIQLDNPFKLAQYRGFNLDSDKMEGTYDELESGYLKMISIGEVIKYNFPYNVVMGDHGNYYVNVYIMQEDGNYKVDKIEVKKFGNNKQ